MDKPKDVISEEDMVQVLTQLYLSKNLDRSYVKKGKLDYTQQQAYILQNHGFSWDQFERSYQYYMLSEDLANPMNEKVKENLSLLILEKDSTQAKGNAELKNKYVPTKKDSLTYRKKTIRDTILPKKQKWDSSQIVPKPKSERLEKKIK